MTKNIFLLSIMFMTNTIVFSQLGDSGNSNIIRKKCDVFLQKELIDKVKNYKPTDLVPFSKDGRNWSFVHINSRKLVTNPILDLPRTFKPNLSFYANDCEFFIQKNYQHSSKEAVIWSTEGKKEKLKATKEGLGFDVDENGKMSAYSKSYARKKQDAWNISEAFLHKEKYYAILKKDTSNVLINQLGVEQKKFNFKQLLLLPYKRKGQLLFYLEDFNNKKGFITIKGKKIKYGKLLSHPFQNSFSGYSIQNDRKSYVEDITISGVLDLTNQKWLIRPQKKVKFIKVIYTSKENIKNRKSSKNRLKADTYFVLKNESYYYVMNEKRNFIKPSNP